MLSWKCPGKWFPEKGQNSALLFITHYRNDKTVQVIVRQNIFFLCSLKDYIFFMWSFSSVRHKCLWLYCSASQWATAASQWTLTSRCCIDHPAEWGSGVSGRGSTLYLLMWFWSFQIRAVRAVCRHEAQAEYTNPAAAWHRTHTQTLSQRLKVTVSASQSGRRQGKINEMKEYGNK